MKYQALTLLMSCLVATAWATTLTDPTGAATEGNKLSKPGNSQNPYLKKRHRRSSSSSEREAETRPPWLANDEGHDVYDDYPLGCTATPATPATSSWLISFLGLTLGAALFGVGLGLGAAYHRELQKNCELARQYAASFDLQAYLDQVVAAIKNQREHWAVNMVLGKANSALFAQRIESITEHFLDLNASVSNNDANPSQFYQMKLREVPTQEELELLFVKEAGVSALAEKSLFERLESYRVAAPGDAANDLAAWGMPKLLKEAKASLDSMNRRLKLSSQPRDAEAIFGSFYALDKQSYLAAQTEFVQAVLQTRDNLTNPEPFSQLTAADLETTFANLFSYYHHLLALKPMLESLDLNSPTASQRVLSQPHLIAAMAELLKTVQHLAKYSTTPLAGRDLAQLMSHGLFNVPALGEDSTGNAFGAQAILKAMTRNLTASALTSYYLTMTELIERLVSSSSGAALPVELVKTLKESLLVGAPHHSATVNATIH